MAALASGRPQPALPRHVRESLAARASALAVLDRRATVVGDASECAGAEAILAWAETEAIAATRAELGLVPPACPAEAPWIEKLWSLAAEPAVVRRCHDRRFWLALASGRGETLPETHLVSTLGELRAVLPAVCRRSTESAWIAKAPYSASGRERVYRWGANFPPDIETRLERLFDRYGELIVEPRMVRVGDVGVAGWVDGSGANLLAPHTLHCDGAGVFRKIDLAPPPLSPAFDRSVREAAEAAGAALFAAGYRGAFGIDAFVYQAVSGENAIHPMCEINARLTFGHIVRAADVTIAAPPT